MSAPNLDRSPLHNAGGWLPRRAATTGERIAVIEGERQISYRELDERSARFASWLRHHGVGRGDRVALLLGNRTAFLDAVFGAARIGAIALPLNTRLAAREIDALLRDADAALLIHEATLVQTAKKACGARPRLEVGGAPDAFEAALAHHAPERDIAPVRPDDPMILMYTSGTTGRPKGALLPHRKTLYNSLNAQLFFDLRSDDRVLVVVPLFHSFGLQILSLPALYTGATIRLEPRFQPDRFWQRVHDDQITFFGAVPTMFRALYDVLAASPENFDLSSLRFAFTAGSAIPVELIHDFKKRGLLLKQGFGQTETSILCCLEERDAIRKAGSVGRPVFHAELRVVDPGHMEGAPETWRDVAPGVTGEIVVRGPITMIGYWQRPKESAETLRGDWLRTGDLATIDDEGFITLVGRARDMYISGGENVYPAEVEAAYHEHPAVREIAVVGVPHERWGESGRAYVVPRVECRVDAEALYAFGRERLASFKVPSEFVEVAELPKTVTGKVQKHRLVDAATS